MIVFLGHLHEIVAGWLSQGSLRHTPIYVQVVALVFFGRHICFLFFLAGAELPPARERTGYLLLVAGKVLSSSYGPVSLAGGAFLAALVRAQFESLGYGKVLERPEHEKL